MAAALSTSETNFSLWLCDRLKTTNNSAADLDTSERIFIDYILAALSDEENSNEEKRESIIPILQELNQVLKLIFLFLAFNFNFKKNQ
jgi:hypothetical protein